MTATTVSGLTEASTGFPAAYDPDAALTLEVHPNGMLAATTRDPVGRETALSWTAVAGGLLAASSRQYGANYDGLGRTRTLPAADSPTGAEVNLAYYGNDLVPSSPTCRTSTQTRGLSRTR